MQIFTIYPLEGQLSADPLNCHVIITVQINYWACMWLQYTGIYQVLTANFMLIYFYNGVSNLWFSSSVLTVCGSSRSFSHIYVIGFPCKSICDQHMAMCKHLWTSHPVQLCRTPSRAKMSHTQKQLSQTASVIHQRYTLGLCLNHVGPHQDQQEIKIMSQKTGKCWTVSPYVEYPTLTLEKMLLFPSIQSSFDLLVSCCLQCLLL